MSFRWILLLPLLLPGLSPAAVKPKHRWEISAADPVLSWRFVNDPASAGYAAGLADVQYAFDQWGSVESSYLRFDEVSSGEDIAVEIVDEEAGYPGTVLQGDRITSCHVTVGGHTAGANQRFWLMHEIGHCLGLVHSVVPHAVMSYRALDTDDVLHEDDRFALTLLYSNQEISSPAGCASGSLDSGSRNVPPGGGPYLQILAMVLLVRAAYAFASRRVRRAPALSR